MIDQHNSVDSLFCLNFLNKLQSIQTFPTFTTDSELDLGRDFGWATVEHEYAMIYTIPTLAVCLRLLHWWKVNLCSILKWFVNHNSFSPRFTQSSPDHPSLCQLGHVFLCLLKKNFTTAWWCLRQVCYVLHINLNSMYNFPQPHKYALLCVFHIKSQWNLWLYV